MIVCLEGINGSGKSLLAKTLLAQWTAAGGTATLVEPVQYTPFGRSVRTAIMTTEDLAVEAESLAFASTRLHAARTLSRQDGQDLIVIERWAGAVVAYGSAVGVEPTLLTALETILTTALPIRFTYLVDVPGDLATDRLADQQDTNRFETAGSAYLETVRRHYLTWARRHHVEVISGTAEPQERASWASRILRSQGLLPSPVVGVADLPFGGPGAE